jgi:hypothetical protein
MFHSPSLLKAHIRNTHVTPLRCTYPGCSYKKPFGRECDLRRHFTTKHNTERKYRCPESDCQETFSRKDKMMKYTREKHELFSCSCNYCAATVFGSKRESYLRKSYGLYKYTVGSCQSGRRSYFDWSNLHGHLHMAYYIVWDNVIAIIRSLHPFPLPAKKAEVLYTRVELYPKYRDCTSCFAENNNKQ